MLKCLNGQIADEYKDLRFILHKISSYNFGRIAQSKF